MTEKPTFFGRRAIIVLMVVFFLVPFALRGARMAVQGMKNDVRDWLPKGFAETDELNWFRQHFVSEQFVVLSWEGCTGAADDHRYNLFIAKLQPELPPSKQPKKPAADEMGEGTEATTDSANSSDSETAAAGESAVGDSPAATPAAAAPEGEAEKSRSPIRYVQQKDFIGDRLGLYMPLGSDGNFLTYDNWGNRGEKWLKGRKNPESDSVEECWYYITPNGDLFRWDGVDSPVASAYRHFHAKFVTAPTTGELVHAFGEVDGKWYHEDPRRLRAQLFKTVTTGPDVLANLTGPGGELEKYPEEAKQRLTGMLFGPKNDQTAIVVTLSEAAKHNLHLVLGRGILGKPRGRLYEVAAESNISEADLRLGGPPVDNVAIDEEGSITLFRLIGMTAVLGICLSMACFRTISATIMVFFCGGISAVLTLSMMWWFGSTVDAIAMSLPAMVYVLGLSGATHLINYYYEAVDHGGVHGAPERALKAGWKPNLMCNITTSIGMFTLMSSELIPIQKFGFYAGLGVLTATIIEFTYLPAALQIWPQLRKKKPEPTAGNTATSTSGDDQPWLDKYLSTFWTRLATFIIKHHNAVAIGCVLLIAITGYGVVYVKTSVNMLKMFSPEAKLIKDYQWLEANLGQLVPMEVIVKMPKDSLLPPAEQIQAENAQLRQLEQELADATTDEQKQEVSTALGKLENLQATRQLQMPFLERMELAARMQRVVQEEFGAEGRDKIGRAMSAATFVRELPKPTEKMYVRSTTSRRLEAHRDEFLHSDYLRVDQADEAELWRVSLRVAATKGVDYGVLINELQDVIEPILSAKERRDQVVGKLIATAKDRDRPAEVLLLGVPERSSKKADQAAAETPNSTEKPIDQTRIFGEALGDMLAIKSIRVKSFTPGTDKAPANWNEYLAGFDCVVLIKDHDAFAGFDLRRSSKLLIDAREHTFDGLREHTAAKRANATKESKTKVAHAVYTGVVPIVYKAQRSLLDSLIQSTFWSFITITPLLMFISRSVWGGLVAMLPNVLPVLMVFGGMGWLGLDVDVGAMMTASIALGVAVDDTIHYLNWYREELDKVKDRHLAILGAYKHCATPTFQAAIISGLGLSVFALSTFTPTQRFGHLMLVILWAGVAAELIFFPAILAGPLGVVFKPRKLKDEEVPATPTLTLHSPSEPAFEPAAESALEEATHAVPAPAGKAALLNQLRHDSPHGKKR